MAKLTFIGGAQKVTGSCYLLQTGTLTVLLDCGMHQGGSLVKRIHKEQFIFDVAQVDALILSHAHLDHAGLLP